MYIWRKLHLRYILFYVLAVIRSYVWNISHVLRLSQLKDSRLISVPGCTNYCWVSRRTFLLPGQVWCRQLQFMSQAHLCFADQCQSPSIHYPLRFETIPWASHSSPPHPQTSSQWSIGQTSFRQSNLSTVSLFNSIQVLPTTALKGISAFVFINSTRQSVWFHLPVFM